MTKQKNPEGKRGMGKGVKGISTNPDGSFKSRLLGKQKDSLKTLLSLRMGQQVAMGTRSAGSTPATAGRTREFSLTPAIINSIVAEINCAQCLYCKAGVECNHKKRNICFAQDVNVAYNSLNDTAETIRANKAQKVVDKANQLITRRRRIEVAARTEKAARKAARAKVLLAIAVLEEADEWITKVHYIIMRYILLLKTIIF